MHRESMTLLKSPFTSSARWSIVVGLDGLDIGKCDPAIEEETEWSWVARMAALRSSLRL